MEMLTFNNDIQVMYVQADSFPNGVLAAHQKLHGKIPFSTGRKYLGISRPEGGGGIQYKAGAEVLAPGEPAQYGFDTLVLPKGNYISVTINNYMKDLPAIGNTFQQLIKQPGIDPEGYCVEWYISDKDVICMVRVV